MLITVVIIIIYFLMCGILMAMNIFIMMIMDYYLFFDLWDIYIYISIVICGSFILFTLELRHWESKWNYQLKLYY